MSFRTLLRLLITQADPAPPHYVPQECRRMSTRLLLVSPELPLAHLHIIICYLNGWEKESIWSFEDASPREEDGYSFRDKTRWEIVRPYDDFDENEALGDGLLGTWGPDFSVMRGTGPDERPSRHFYYSRDARTHNLSDVFLDSFSPHNQDPLMITLEYLYQDSKNISCFIKLDPDQPMLQVSTGIQGNLCQVLSIEGGAWEYEEGYERRRKVNNQVAQRKIDRLFEDEEEPEDTGANGWKKKKCVGCKEGGICDLELGRGCRYYSTLPCCPFCRREQAWYEEPILDPHQLQLRVQQLEVEIPVHDP